MKAICHSQLYQKRMMRVHYKNIQRLAREAAFCITCLSNGGLNIDWGNSIFTGLGMEAVLPIEVEIPSLRVLREVELKEAEWVQARYEQLNLIEEKRMKAICHGQLYQKRMMRAHDKKIRSRQFQEGELVLKRILQNRQDPHGKWSPNWEGPYVVKKAFSRGALILIEMDGKEFPGPINADIVKKYYA